jgi:beta-lactamase class A
MIDRRHFLVAASGLVLSPALAEDAPPVLAAYERDTGGRIGVYGENLSTGTKIAWRAEERFVMCSTFKASLVAFVLARVDKAEDRLADMVAYGAKDLLDYAPVAKQNLAQGPCRLRICARRSSNSATTPARTCCWRGSVGLRP